MKQIPKMQRRFVSIDIGACSACRGCIEVAPSIFTWSESGGYVEVRDLDYYDEDLVAEAIKWCPEDCIFWDDEG